MTSRPGLLHAGAALASLALVFLLVAGASRAAFTGETEQAATFAAGTVSLASTASVALDAANMAPSDEVVGCVTVEYTGSLATSGVDVRIDVDLNDNGLAPVLAADIELGTAGSTCGSFTADGGPISYASIDSGSATATGWAPATAAETRAFRITVTLDATADNTYQGETASAAIVWTANS